MAQNISEPTSTATLRGPILWKQLNLARSIATNGLDEALAEQAYNFNTQAFQREYIEANGVEADLREHGYYTA